MLRKKESWERPLCALQSIHPFHSPACLCLNRRHVSIAISVLLNLGKWLAGVVRNDAVQVGLVVHDLLGLYT